MNIEDIKKENPCKICRKREYCSTECPKYKHFIQKVINDKWIIEYASTNEKTLEVLNALSRD